MGGLPGERGINEREERKGYRTRNARARPSNTAVRDLLGNEAYTNALVAFLGGTEVGVVKAGSRTGTKYRWPPALSISLPCLSLSSVPIHPSRHHVCRYSVLVAEERHMATSRRATGRWQELRGFNQRVPS